MAKIEIKTPSDKEGFPRPSDGHPVYYGFNAVCRNKKEFEDEFYMMTKAAEKIFRRGLREAVGDNDRIVFQIIHQTATDRVLVSPRNPEYQEGPIVQPVD